MLIPTLLILNICKYIPFDTHKDKKWYKETLPLVCKRFYNNFNSNVMNYNCHIINGICVTHHDYEFFIKHKDMFEILFRRDEYEDDEGRLYLHFNEDIEYFIQNYKFLNFGLKCCQGRGISIESHDN